jgi:arginyl-tRNA synthetase
VRSSSRGDDKDRVLVKSDGSYTYLLPDTPTTAINSAGRRRVGETGPNCS